MALQPVPFWLKLMGSHRQHGGVPPAAGPARGNEAVRKYPTRPLVFWRVYVWEKGPGYGEDAKNPAIQCGWEEVEGG